MIVSCELTVRYIPHHTNYRTCNILLSLTSPDWSLSLTLTTSFATYLDSSPRWTIMPMCRVGR